MRVLLPGLPVLLLLLGCAQPQSFRVVDAYTGKPLAGVQVERLETSLRPSPVPLVLVEVLHPVESATTDGSGMVHFRKSSSHYAFNPNFTNHKCGKAFVSKGWTGTFIRYPEEYMEVPASQVDGVTEVPMRRKVFLRR